jgi:hypothetical protein
MNGLLYRAPQPSSSSNSKEERKSQPDIFVAYFFFLLHKIVKEFIEVRPLFLAQSTSI